MENIKINFLGTGSAVPTAKRNHTGILLSYKNENILVDCGEGIQRQFRIAKINPCKITKILITHWHGDHVLGIPGLIQTLAFSNYNKTLEIYGPKGTSKFIKELFNVFVFKEDKIKINVHEIGSGKFFENNDFYLESFKLKHGPDCLGYNFVLKNKLKINKQKLKKLKIKPGKWLNKIKQGKDVKIKNKKISHKNLTYFEKGKKISLILDTSYFSDLYKKAKDADLLVIESSFFSDSEESEKKAEEYEHLTEEQAANIGKKAKVKKIVLTHISQRYEKDFNKIEKKSRKIFKNTKIAKDFLEIKL